MRPARSRQRMLSQWLPLQETLSSWGIRVQLGQPVKGVHPGEAGLSVLEFLLGEDSTIAPEQGIFLNRNLPAGDPVSAVLISNAFYDGKLRPHENTSRRILNLRGSNLPNEGLVLASANHEGCSQTKH